MKKFIKSTWFLGAIALVAIMALLAFLYCKGFRITYAPDLENSWDAISAFAARSGVVMSFLAIMIAIWIPKKIADRQDRIALFEKKLEIYNILSSCSASAKILKLIHENGDILRYLFSTLAYTLHPENEFNDNEIKPYLLSCSAKLRPASFFFPEKVMPYITEVSYALLILANADVEVDGEEKFNEKKQRYFNVHKSS